MIDTKYDVMEHEQADGVWTSVLQLTVCMALDKLLVSELISSFVKSYAPCRVIKIK